MEFGSPKVPMFAEAMLLHHLDNLDSKMECIRGMVERDRLVEGVWTGYSSALDRSLLKKRKYMEADAAVERAPTARIETTPEKPSAPEPPKRPPVASPFGDKLLTALRQEK
jgi:3'-5' exoribonuclease